MIMEIIECFNPCRVFSGLATFPALIALVVGIFVSIPVGFFQALQHLLDAATMSSISLFQSLSGFFRPCNLCATWRTRNPI